MQNKIFVLFILLFALLSCNEKYKLGTGFLSDDEKIQLLLTDTVEIQMYTERVNRDSLNVGMPEYMMVGSYDDPVFGTSKSSFATQFHALSHLTIENTYVLDSVCLVMPIPDEDYYYGGTNSGSIDLVVYELKEQLDTTIYHPSQSIAELTHNNETLLGSGLATQKQIIYTNENDKSDTTMALVLKLKDEFGSSLFTDYYLLDANKFHERFFGIYVESTNPGTGIFKTYSVGTNSDDIGIVFYYHTSDGTNKKYAVISHKNSYKFNHFEHIYDNSLTVGEGAMDIFTNQLDNPDKVDSVAFLQSMAGTMVRVEIPGIYNLKDVVINKAELILKNSQSAIFESDKYAPLDQIWLVASDKKNIILFNDFTVNSMNQGASLQDSTEYSFIVTRIIQNIIDGNFESDKYNLYLVNLLSGSSFKRSVLTTGKNTEPAKLVLTYTKYK